MLELLKLKKSDSTTIKETKIFEYIKNMEEEEKINFLNDCLREVEAFDYLTFYMSEIGEYYPTLEDLKKVWSDSYCKLKAKYFYYENGVYFSTINTQDQLKEVQAYQVLIIAESVKFND